MDWKALTQNDSAGYSDPASTISELVKGRDDQLKIIRLIDSGVRHVGCFPNSPEKWDRVYQQALNWDAEPEASDALHDEFCNIMDAAHAGKTKTQPIFVELLLLMRVFLYSTQEIQNHHDRGEAESTIRNDRHL